MVRATRSQRTKNAPPASALAGSSRDLKGQESDALRAELTVPRSR